MADRRGPAVLALTMGEPAGIGGEIALKAWRQRASGVPPFCMIDDPLRLEALAEGEGIESPVQTITRLADATAVFAHALPVLAEPLPAAVTPGRPDGANAPAVLRSIERAARLAASGEAAAMVTNPIHKGALYAAGFRHPGHTEYLAALAGVAEPVMMLAVPGLRAVPVTVHLPLQAAIAQLTRARIVQHGRVTDAALRRDFGIARPRIAVAGLNPHAGEGGALGREEIEIIAPAVAELRAAGIDAFGPAPADSLFHPGARARFDAVLCMYHDQALIPVKTIDFAHGVNITLGLPFIRTSPDHGTAFDIAGSGQADPSSLIAALMLAAEMAARRAAASA
ncbi:MAG: 4-hydroxythreonine-4-phosphate dehydrogenase PdxA [Alphaproteobacteria bacterium]|nr:4-hydroxythreonine-4-phosphate dehydrogenase PdxA [Alphaproteobacteria bacterium]